MHIGVFLVQSHVLHRAVNDQDVIKMSDGHRNVVIKRCDGELSSRATTQCYLTVPLIRILSDLADMTVH